MQNLKFKAVQKKPKHKVVVNINLLISTILSNKMLLDLASSICFYIKI